MTGNESVFVHPTRSFLAWPSTCMGWRWQRELGNSSRKRKKGKKDKTGKKKQSKPCGFGGQKSWFGSVLGDFGDDFWRSKVKCLDCFCF